MPRHAKDEWDIASSVGLTALGVAGGRAIESKRSDALVVDPYAEALVSSVDAGVPMPTRLPHPGYEDDEQFEQMWSRTATHMGLRSRFFDEFFARGWREGVTQAVILASGLDARPWRLDWPQECTVFEIDQPQVLDFKDQVVAREDAKPSCAHRTVAIDLREDWPAALQEAGFDRSRPTAWLAEGLLMYLPEEAEAQLLSAVHQLSAPGSRIALEHARSLQEQVNSNDWHERMTKQFGIDIAELFYDNAGRPDPDERLAEMGWQADVTTGEDLAAAHGRTDEGMPVDITREQRYITAQLPG